MNWRSPNKLFWKPFFLENTCGCVLGLGLERSCPWRREGLSSERLSLASDFFVSLASSLVSSTPPLLITFLFTKLSWPGDSEGIFLPLSQAATFLPHTAEASHSPFHCWTLSRKAMNTNFHYLWFDPIGKQTRVYRFCSGGSIDLTTNQLYTVSTK